MNDNQIIDRAAAIDFAITDMGLSEEEAEMATDDFVALLE